MYPKIQFLPKKPQFLPKKLTLIRKKPYIKENKRKVNKNNIRAKYSEDEDLNRVILDFLEYRKKIGKPMTDHAVSLMKKKLSELSQDKGEQIQILEQSIMNGWQGVFPLKKDRQRSQTYTPKPNQFHNFDQRETDYDALIREQVKAQMKNQKNE